MNFGGVKLTAVTAALLAFAMACSGPSLQAYTPQDQTERDIIALLIQYQEAKMNCDLEAYLACLHEHGEYHFGRGTMASKQQLREWLPGFWAGLKTGNRKYYPMNREMITGNYILSGRFYNPDITVNEETAEARVLFMKWGWRLHHYISLVRENGQWRIVRLDWDTN
jgi:hypothetical protein